MKTDLVREPRGLRAEAPAAPSLASSAHVNGREGRKRKGGHSITGSSETRPQPSRNFTMVLSVSFLIKYSVLPHRDGGVGGDDNTTIARSL